MVNGRMRGVETSGAGAPRPGQRPGPTHSKPAPAWANSAHMSGALLEENEKGQSGAPETVPQNPPG
jgi:hypothetical protein